MPTVTQIRRRLYKCFALHKCLGGNSKLRPCDSTKLSVSDKTYSERFRICLVVSLRALPKWSRLSKASNRSFLISHFDSVLSSSSARNLQNLIVSKDVGNSRATRQCDWLIVRSFLDCSVSFSTSSVRKARSISGLCLARDRSIRATMYLGATLLDAQALRMLQRT